MACTGVAGAQDAALQQKLAAAKQAAAQNQQALRTYSWLEKTEPDGTNYSAAVSLKIPASQIEVRITNSNYQRVAQ